MAVIGAGVVGSAIARELLGHHLEVALIEARADVGDGTSKANTALLHTGFDATPATLEARLVRRGYELMSAYAAQTGIPIERTGAILVAWTEQELQTLPKLLEKAKLNGCPDCELIDPAEVYRQLPALAAGVRGGLSVPGESITCTWTATLALATEARLRGARLLLGRKVTSVSTNPAGSDGFTTLGFGGGGELRTGWVINAAGLGADTVDELFGHHRFRVTPRRGELLVYDKLARPLADRIVLPVPSAAGKGVLIAPTVYGNVMLGPTAENLSPDDPDDRTRTSTSTAGFEFLLEKGAALMPDLLQEEVTASYAGLRAAIDSGDYLIDVDARQRYLLVGGIRSTGLSSSMAIAEYVRELLADAGLELRPRAQLPPPPRMPNLGEAFGRPYQDPAAIEADPEYGRIVCFCERVTAGEIRDSLRSPIPPTDLPGLRRRTRAMNGRCQGFYCGAEVEARLVAGLAERAAESGRADRP